MQDTVVLVTTDSLGKGDAELGKKLLTNFFRLVSERDSMPKGIFFLNSGVYLTATGSPVLESLQELERKGVEVLSCQTCANSYGLQQQIQVGLVVGMDELLSLADRYRVLTLA